MLSSLEAIFTSSPALKSDDVLKGIHVHRLILSHRTSLLNVFERTFNRMCHTEEHRGGIEHHREAKRTQLLRREPWCFAAAFEHGHHLGHAFELFTDLLQLL